MEEMYCTVLYLTVAVPSKWIDPLGLEVGDLLFLSFINPSGCLQKWHILEKKAVGRLQCVFHNPPLSKPSEQMTGRAWLS